ncbi:DUF4754 family protein [Escherichia fergusonii]|nr:DUF4754 family protein [Escherichia fergusonii]
MDKEYKTLINKALERFYFRLSASGAHAERATAIQKRWRQHQRR